MDYMNDATAVEKMILAKAAEKRQAINGSMELLPLCNMNCDMCYVRLSRAEMEAQGRLRTADEWLELAEQMKKAGVLFLLLTGGEPLLYPEFKRLYLGLKQLGMILTINTNGTLINEEWAEFFGQNRPRRINVTLYGSDREAYQNLCHYGEGYEKAVQGIRLLRAYGVDVKVNGSLVKANWKDLGRIPEIARSLDAAVHVDTYMYPATRERHRPYNEQARLNPEDAAEARIRLLREEKTPEEFLHMAMGLLDTAAHTPPGEAEPGHVRCLAGRASFTVNWQGEMRPCVMLTSPSAPAFEIGFEAAWKYITEEVDKILLSPACSECCLRKVCRTCAACALSEAGSYRGVPEYMCRYTKATLACLEKAVMEYREESRE